MLYHLYLPILIGWLSEATSYPLVTKEPCFETKPQNYSFQLKISTSVGSKKPVLNILLESLITSGMTNKQNSY